LSEKDATKAKQHLLRLAKQLDELHPGAASSVREGLDEVLTLHRLGIQGSLYQSLKSTNSIENLQGSIKTLADMSSVGEVDRWPFVGASLPSQKPRGTSGESKAIVTFLLDGRP